MSWDWLVLQIAELRSWDQEILAFMWRTASGRKPSLDAKVAFNALLVKRDKLVSQFLKQLTHTDHYPSTTDPEKASAALERAVLTGSIRSADPNPYLNGKGPSESV